MVVAWIWLFCLIINMIFLSGTDSNILLKLFDKLVMISCFLVYPFAAEKEKTVYPFLYQFLFWWLFGAAMIALYRFISKKKKINQ